MLDAKFFIELIEINKNSVAFFKPGCPFCTASQKLIDELEAKNLISGFEVYTVGVNCTEETLAEVCRHFGWQAKPFEKYPTKPQIFVKGQYVGGNFEFYKSEYNVSEGMPNLANPMRF